MTGPAPDHAIRRAVDRYRHTRGHVAALVEVIDEHLDDALDLARRDGESYGKGRAEHADQLLEQSRETCDRWREIAESRGRMLDDKRTIRETNTDAGDGEVKVKLGRDYGGSWTIGDVDELLYRFRLGGGTDDTVVEGIGREVSAVLPAPNLITLEPIGGRRTPLGRPAPLPDPVVIEGVWPNPASARLLVVGVLLVVVSVLIGVAVL